MTLSKSMITMNSSYRCGLPPVFPPALNIPQAIDYIQAAIAITAGLVGCLLNLLLLFMIIKYKSLHQRLMYLALQIALVDLLYTVTIPPVIFTSGITGEYQFGDFMCNILGFIHDFFCDISVYYDLNTSTRSIYIRVLSFFLHEKFLSFNLCAPSNGLHSIFCSSHPALIRHHGVFPLRPHSEDLHSILWVFRWMSHTYCLQQFVHCFIWNNISINIVHHSLPQD